MNNMTNCNITTGNPSLTHATNRVRGAARLEIVCEGLLAGKSQRQIARELGFDEGTVRRDIAILCLPPDQLAAIRQGATAEKFLNQARLQRTGKDRSAVARHRKRLATDKGSGVYSNPLATTTLDWLVTKDPATHNQEVVLTTLKQPRRTRPDHNGAPRSDRAEVLATLARRMPKQSEIGTLNYCVEVLNSALILLEPIEAIRIAAIDKALKEIRVGEPWPPYPDKWKAECAKIRRRRDPKK